MGKQLGHVLRRKTKGKTNDPARGATKDKPYVDDKATGKAKDFFKEALKNMPAVEIRKSDKGICMEFATEEAAIEFLEKGPGMIDILSYAKVERVGSKVSISMGPMVRQLVKSRGASALKDMLPVTIVE